MTRNPLVGMLMALMNLRFGFWVPNPNDESRRSRFRRSCTKSFRANHFDPGLKEVLGVSLQREVAGLPAQRRRAFREPRRSTS